MFISDAFLHLRERLEAELPTNIEFQEYFAPLFASETLDEPSRYLAAASCFLLLQLNLWERVILAVEDQVLTEAVLTYDHVLIGRDDRPAPAVVEVRKLPTSEGKLRLDMEPVEVAETFIGGLAPRAFLFVIASSAAVALSALETWLAWDRPASSAAILIKAPLSDMDPLVAAVQRAPHRVAGWLNLPVAGGRTDILALFVLGARLDEI